MGNTCCKNDRTERRPDDDPLDGIDRNDDLGNSESKMQIEGSNPLTEGQLNSRMSLAKINKQRSLREKNYERKLNEMMNKKARKQKRANLRLPLGRNKIYHMGTHNIILKQYTDIDGECENQSEEDLYMADNFGNHK